MPLNFQIRLSFWIHEKNIDFHSILHYMMRLNKLLFSCMYAKKVKYFLKILKIWKKTQHSIFVCNSKNYQDTPKQQEDFPCIQVTEEKWNISLTRLRRERWQNAKLQQNPCMPCQTMPFRLLSLNILFGGFLLCSG